MTKTELTLPSNRVFVVQFRAEEPDSQSGFKGRVEHVVSGQAIRFESWECLQQFIQELLTKVSDKPP